MLDGEYGTYCNKHGTVWDETGVKILRRHHMGAGDVSEVEFGRCCVGCAVCCLHALESSKTEISRWQSRAHFVARVSRVLKILIQTCRLSFVGSTAFSLLDGSL